MRRLLRWYAREVGLQGTLLIGGSGVAVNGVYVLWGDGVALLVGGVVLVAAGVIGGIMEHNS